jgi:hypothetical protein
LFTVTLILFFQVYCFSKERLKIVFSSGKGERR